MPNTLNDDDTPRCTHCQRLLFHHELDRWACNLCEDRAREHLNALPSLYEQLGDALTPTTGNSDGSKVSVSRLAPLPVALAPLDLRAAGGMVSKLQAIEDNWRTVLGRPASPRSDGVRLFASWRSNPGSDVPIHANFLVINLRWACERYEEVAYDLGVIRDLHNHAQTLITGQRESRVPIGHCPAVNENTGQACGEPLRVSPQALSICCRECGTQWDRGEWLRLGAQMRGLPLPGKAA